MEPIQSTTAAESAPPPSSSAPDPQLQHATETLAGQMGGAEAKPSGQEWDSAIDSAAEEQPAAPPRAALRQQATQGWRQRQQARDRELRERRALQEGYESRLAEANRLNMAALEALRSGAPAPQEEEIPDPTLDPVGFARYMRESNQRAIQEALKPLMDAEQARREADQQRWQEGQRTAAQSEAVAARRELQDDWRAAYEQDAPDLAAGFDDRYIFMHEKVSGAWTGLCHPGDEATLTNTQFGAVMRYAEAVGANPVMFLDAWMENLAGQFGWSPAGGAVGGAAPAPVNGNGNGHQPAAETEIDRLAKVRQRASGATSAAPRQPGRATTTRSELQDLLRGGVRDIPQLQAAAIKDAGGDRGKAAILMQQAAAQVG